MIPTSKRLLLMEKAPIKHIFCLPVSFHFPLIAIFQIYPK